MSNELLLERIKLKSQTKKWRIIAIILLVVLLITQSPVSGRLLPGQDYIAKIDINGFIGPDKNRATMLTNLEEDDNVKAVIMHVDSPGGSASAGEAIYNHIKRIREKKPVVVVMHNMATSAAYMISLPTDQIFAQRGTLTGSIGVILQSPDVSELAKKVGVNVNQLTSGDLKGEPNMFKPMNDKTKRVLLEVINDFHNVFVDLIVTERNMTEAKVRLLADGRVYSGQQAKANGLIDTIGGEIEAVAWLESEKGLKDIKVLEVKPKSEKDKLREMLTGAFSGDSLLPKQFTSYGLLSYYQHGSM